MDTSQPDPKDIIIADLRANVKELTERNEHLARLVLDLQETVKKLQDEINRLKGQKSRPKIPPSSLERNNKGNKIQMPIAKLLRPYQDQKKSNTKRSSSSPHTCQKDLDSKATQIFTLRI